MWTIQIKNVSPHTQRYQILWDGRVLSWRELLQLWMENERFCLFYHQSLADSSWEAFFWEHPPVSKYSLEEPYEFVLINALSLEGVTPESNTFATYYQEGESVAVFANLRGDATLVVPTPSSNEDDFGHLARFVRKASVEQAQAFWQRLGFTVNRMLSEEDRWLSTSGLGVYWLHVRLDSRPKYYQHQPYRQL